MTYEEALNEINQECVYCRTSNNCAKDECIWFICKKAIDKQIPKKHIIEINNNGLKELHCYSCNATHGVYGDVRIPTTSKCCPYCSQAIDWSDEE